MDQLTKAMADDVLDPALAVRYLVDMPQIQGTNSNIPFVAESVQATFPKIPSQGRHAAGTNVYYPDFNDIDGITLTFYEDHLHRVHHYARAWRELVLHPDGNYGLPIDFKKQVILKMFRVDDSSIPAVTHTFLGCWPTDIQAYDLAYDNTEERVKVVIQLSVDSQSSDWAF